MDPIASLAASTVTILAPYLAEAGHEFAKEGGKAVAVKIEALYQMLKKRFKKKSSAKEALADLEADPKSQDAQASLRLQIAKQLKDDPAFADSLRDMLKEIDEDQSSRSFITQVYGGEVGEIVNAGNIGTLTINKSPRKK